MRVFKITLLLFFLMSALGKVTGQPKEQKAEHKKQSAFVGRWTLKGMENSYLEICDNVSRWVVF